MKLYCVAKYVNGARGLVYEPGQVLDVTENERTYLLADAPGCFRKTKPRAKQVDAPPADKAVKSPTKEK